MYFSNKRAGFVSNSESVKSTNTKGRRKHSASDKKKRQARKVATAGTIMQSPGLQLNIVQILSIGSSHQATCLFVVLCPLF